MLTPCKQWICDECRKLIAGPEQGWFEWLCGPNQRDHYGFRIVHDKPSSPRSQNPNGCYKYSDHSGRKDGPLKEFLSDVGRIRLVGFIDVGSHHDPDADYTPRVKSLREWAEIYRRLFFPYYEEARLYWEHAAADGFLATLNETAVYSADTLKSLVEKYGQR
jgi:hypothetical protein